MQQDFWKGIVDAISVMKPESVDKEQIMSMLQWNRTYPIEVLDSFYMRKIITLDKYTEYVRMFIERQEEEIKWAKDRLDGAQQRKETFDPYVYYGFGFASRGPVIDNEIHSAFEKRGGT